MKYMKIIGGLGLIALCISAGTYFSIISGSGGLAGAMLGAILGVILLAFVNWFVSRRSEGFRPVTDGHQVKNSERVESAEAKYRRMQESQMDEFLREPRRINIL